MRSQTRGTLSRDVHRDSAYRVTVRSETAAGSKINSLPPTEAEYILCRVRLFSGNIVVTFFNKTLGVKCIWIGVYLLVANDFPHVHKDLEVVSGSFS